MSDLESTRVFGSAGRGLMRIGLGRRPLKDLYHWLVTGPWTRLLFVFGAVYFATQGLFAAGHLAVRMESVPRGTLLDALLVVLGRAPRAGVDVVGNMKWIAAEILSSVEGFVRWLELAVGSGIIFAKFALLKARVLFSRAAVVAPYENGLALMFRMANERTSHIVDAKVNAMLVWSEPSEDGELIRRAHDLPLQRGGSALFSHAWTALHVITRDSPLFGQSAASLEAREADVFVTLSGYDEALTRVIHARHVYGPRAIRWSARFRDIVSTLPNGVRAVDYRKFHEVVAAEPDRKEERTPARRVR